MHAHPTAEATMRLTALDFALRNTDQRTETESIIKRASAFHSFVSGPEEATVSDAQSDEFDNTGRHISDIEGDGPSVSGPHPAFDPYHMGAHAMIHELVDLVNSVAAEYTPSTQVSIAQVQQKVVSLLEELHAAGPSPEARVEIGGVSMYQSQYEAARRPLIVELLAYDSITDRDASTMTDQPDEQIELARMKGWNAAIDAVLDGGNGYRDEATVTAGDVRRHVSGLRK